MFTFLYIFFFFKQKTAYEMRISDWSSDVCSSDLFDKLRANGLGGQAGNPAHIGQQRRRNIDAAVGLLVVFEDRHQRSPDREPRAVERMDELIALDVFTAEARVHAARLEIAAVDRKSVVSGQSVSVRVALGGRRLVKKKKK